MSTLDSTLEVKDETQQTDHQALHPPFRELQSGSPEIADRIGYTEAARQCGQTKAGRIWRLSLTYFPAEADYTQYLGLSQPVGL
ncbi:hypothetical protein [Thiothrix eikelboomii]|uniref:hypothetical protein n=1 Tax=Thiothrix eikelboomii TaxID=92487 RepID=UPI0011802E28|nr:hypothetical protein [Thiothrix eikelboomii]